MLLQYVLGKGGVALMLIVVFMAVTSAGSSEFMAVGSLFTFDIYKVSWRPCTDGARTPVYARWGCAPMITRCALSMPGAAYRSRCMQLSWISMA